jgi:hypothetical protein
MNPAKREPWSITPEVMVSWRAKARVAQEEQGDAVQQFGEPLRDGPMRGMSQLDLALGGGNLLAPWLRRSRRSRPSRDMDLRR